MKTIIAPIDFSKASLNAANYAADLAAYLSADLVLLNVVQIPIATVEVALTEQIFGEMIQSASEDLDTLAASLRVRTKNKIEVSAEVTAGSVEYQIEDLSRRRDPFAIVMGLQSGKETARLFWGSDSLFAMKHSHLPVLIVPENFNFNQIKKIGLAVDFSSSDALPFESIINCLSELQARLDIIYVNNSARDIIIEKPISAVNRLNHFHPEFHFIENADPAEGLSDFAGFHELDLLMIISRKHGFRDLFDEKHAKKIITHQDIPVLAIPAH
jgi:nucleotide-binding universal stress UspA family protein